jgi:hypothetical protein
MEQGFHHTVLDYKGIQEVGAIYYFIYFTKGPQEQIYCHFSM